MTETKTHGKCFLLASGTIDCTDDCQAWRGNGFKDDDKDCIILKAVQLFSDQILMTMHPVQKVEHVTMSLSDIEKQHAHKND